MYTRQVILVSTILSRRVHKNPGSSTTLLYHYLVIRRDCLLTQRDGSDDNNTGWPTLTSPVSWRGGRYVRQTHTITERLSKGVCLDYLIKSSQMDLKWLSFILWSCEVEVRFVGQRWDGSGKGLGKDDSGKKGRLEWSES